MSFPAQDSVNTNMVFVEKIADGIFRMINNTGATITQHDYVQFNGYLGVALQTALDTESFDLQVSDEIEVHANDLTVGADTFGTYLQTVYFNPATGKFGDTAGTGIAVGRLSVTKGTAGEIKFFNIAKHMPLEGEAETFEVLIDADATLGLTFDPGYEYKILDVVAYSTATVALATVTLSDGTNDITNAIDIDTISTRFAATTVDEVFASITGADVLTMTTASAADRCRLLITVKAL